MNKHSEQWVRANRKAIISSIQARYGDNWRSCFPVSVQQALFDAEVLNVIMTQALPEYGPAQDMRRALHQEQA